MKKYKLIINPFAEQDLYDVRKWYNLQKNYLGKKVVQEIKKTIKRINENPFQFPIEKKQIRKAVVHKFPYSIFFYINNDIINIFAIFNSHRDPKIWQKRINV